jgi:protease-4
MTVEDVDAIAQGRVWTGAEAIGIGLVDKIGTLEDAINYAAISIEGVDGLEDVQIVEYPKPMGTFEMLLEELTGTEAVFKGTALENIEAAFRDLANAESGKAYARIPYEIIIK